MKTMKQYLSEALKHEKKLNEYYEGKEDDVLTAFARIVGKGGVLPHPKTANFLKKHFKVEPGSRSVEQVIEDLEDINYHTEAAILQALKKRDKKAADLLVDIAEIHQKQGHMPYDVSTLRSYLLDPKKTIRLYGKGGLMPREGMKLSRDAMKILDKMDSKSRKEFMEEIVIGEGN